MLSSANVQFITTIRCRLEEPQILGVGCPISLNVHFFDGRSYPIDAILLRDRQTFASYDPV